MTTTIFHAHTERQRFAQHALASIGGLFSATRCGRRRGELSPDADANRVRELAYSYAKTDPGFASDLYAAAARHEGLDE